MYIGFPLYLYTFVYIRYVTLWLSLCRTGLRNRVLSSTCIRMIQLLHCIDVCLSLYAFESSTARHLSLLKCARFCRSACPSLYLPLSLSLTHAHALTLSFTHTHTVSLFRSLTLSLSLTHSLSISLSLINTHTNTHTYKRTHAHTQTHTHTRLLALSFLSLSLSLYLSLSLSLSPSLHRMIARMSLSAPVRDNCIN